MKQYLGIDIGGTDVKIGIVAADGTIAVKKSYSVDFDSYKTPIITTVLHSIDLFLRENTLFITGISGIGVSATGQIDFKRGTVAGSHIAGWAGTKVKGILETRYGLSTTLLNDAKCAALGEYWHGAARGVRDAIIMTVGTSIGGGIIVNGKLLNGADGYAGEIGFITVQHDGGCSATGASYYEQFASTSALVRMVQEAIAQKKIQWPAELAVNGKTIFSQQSTETQNIIDEWITNVAYGVVSFIHIFNPERIIIGGGISREHDRFIVPLTQKVKTLVMPLYCEKLDLRAAALGNDAGMVGAVYWNIYGGMK